jgi:hypothetical protein|tara:strand:+ start:3426 stop:3635 length:210 start_codon:yes stop_codon:yes gene_type:complete
VKVGDLVMFSSHTSRYAKWFFGKLAVVQSVSYSGDGKLHCRVKWLQPVKYFDTFATISDFAADNFEVSS